MNLRFPACTYVKRRMLSTKKGKKSVVHMFGIGNKDTEFSLGKTGAPGDLKDELIHAI